jgi:hypothetical protein
VEGGEAKLPHPRPLASMELAHSPLLNLQLYRQTNGEVVAMIYFVVLSSLTAAVAVVGNEEGFRFGSRKVYLGRD